MLPNIQQSHIFLSGFFEYDTYKLEHENFSTFFRSDQYYENNQDYFNQKYYPNWLQTLYPQGKEAMRRMGLGKLDSNHFEKIDIGNYGSLSYTVNKDRPRIIPFKVSRISLHLFKENLGIFSIGIQILQPHIDFVNISDLVHGLRNTTHNAKYPNRNPLFEIIENSIIPYVNNNNVSWRDLNPQLKAFLTIDTQTPFATDNEWNSILTDLATTNPIGTMGSKSLYDFQPGYYKQLLEENVLNIFHNWRTMMLFDTVVRISINLTEIDRNQMWENEYITIYIFTLYIQLYLFRVNKRLGEAAKNSHTCSGLRDDFIHFRHDFDLRQISYKFLPNNIFEKFKQVFEIQQEMDKLDEKINRIDTAVREQQERRIERLLAFMVFITGFSIILDGTNLLLTELDVSSETDKIYFLKYFRFISGLMILFFGLIGLSLYKRRSKK